MSRVPTNVLFEVWVRHVFDHAVARISEAWYWEIDSETFELNSMRFVAYATKLFEESAHVLAPYTDEQVDQGFWFLVGATSELDILCSDVVPLPDRLRCIRSIFRLFEQCFARRCTPHLSHITEEGVGPMNSICYMWWDLLWHLITIWRDETFSRQFPEESRLHQANIGEIDEACISVMESILELPSIACQESALHGLGHWVGFRQERCRDVIAAFLKRHPELRPELREYAVRAQEAKIQ